MLFVSHNGERDGSSRRLRSVKSFRFSSPILRPASLYAVPGRVFLAEGKGVMRIRHVF